MSFHVVAKVLDHSKERLARRLILIVLAETAHDDGIVYMGQKLIAEKTLLTRPHVAEKILEMESEKVLEIRKAKRGRKRINVYRLSSLPGLLEPDYERLPFALDEPFTVSEVPTPSEAATTSDLPADDVGSTGLTTSDLAGKSELCPLVEPELGEPPQNLPSKVDRKPVARREGELAVAVLAEWNAQAGQNLVSRDWLSKIILRIRERPDLELADHAHVIAASLADPWWKGPATPSVIYGNEGQFERSLLLVDGTHTPERETLRYGRGMTTKQMLDATRGKT